MLTIATFILASDPTQPDELEKQTILLQSFFSHIPSTFMHFISGSRSVADICNWPGYMTFASFRCESGVLVDMAFRDARKGNMEISYLPPRLDSITIIRCGQQGTLHLRALPRCARLIDFSWNALTGSLTLSQLPERTEKFNVKSNQFYGGISLLNLPKGLMGINLQYNKLQSKRVYYDESFPLSVRHVRLEGNSFGKIIAVNALVKRIDPNIVHGVSKENVD